jgi:hypothetical protein
MVDGTGATGMYYNNSTWRWYFDSSGVLQVGTVPGASVSGNISGNAGTVTNGVYTSAFPNSLAANGYQKVQGGTIIQWGVVTTAVLGTSTVTLPIAFPTACRSVTIGNVAATSAGSGGSFGYANILSASQIQITNDYATTNNSTTYYWIAIGY